MLITTEIISINSTDEIPSIEAIKAIPREKNLKIVFSDALENQRERIGAFLKDKLEGFQIGVHTLEPEINITKLITDEEIEANQKFFEQCAKDYRELGEILIYKLADKLGKKINPECPWMTFTKFLGNDYQTGTLENWNYFLHGFHCRFSNKKTKQKIEVPLVFSLEFGDLDPYFFSIYIKSTSKYQPLPVNIYEDYADGVRINEKMLALGKFERIHSNFDNHYGIVVTDRNKVEIKTFDQITPIPVKSKFNLWKFIIGLLNKKQQ
ncbi:DUF6896 domain-containing protein [Flavobacterium pedocola]